MMECCGNERYTPFCPMCGKLLNQGDLLHLLVHIKSQADSLRQALTSREIYNKEHPNKKWEKPDRHEKYMKALRRRTEKWEGWHESLKTLLEKELK